MAKNVDFILRNGLQVMSNVAVGSYANTDLAPINGMIVSGNVGIGTSTVPFGNVFSVFGPQSAWGNIFLQNDSGLTFTDGTSISSAADISGGFTLGTTEILLGDTYTTIDGQITWTGQQLFNGNLAIPYTGNIMFNGTSDTNWQMGLGINHFNTTYVGNTKSIQIVHGSGSTPPVDGWAVGTASGQSIIETVGYNSTFYVTGAGGLTVVNDSNLGLVTSGTWNGTPISTAYISGLANVATLGTLASLTDVNVSESSGSNSYVLTWNFPSETWIASPTASATLSYGNPGTVQFAGSSNLFAGNSTNFFWNTSTNRLGLGTATPGSLLDVQGTANILNTLSVGGVLTASSVTSNSTITAGTGLTVTTGGFAVTGNSSLIGNLSIDGDIIITGNSYVSETNVLLVENPIIYVGYNNPANSYDIGIVGTYISDSITLYTGLALNHANEQWTLFNTLVTPPTNTIDWSDASITPGNLTLGNIIASGQTFTGTLNVGGLATVNQLVVNTSASFNTVNVINLTLSGTLLANSITSNTNIVGTNFQSTGLSSFEALVANSASIFDSTLTVDGILYVDNNDASTSDTNGGIVVTGGIGMTDNVNVGGTRSLFYGAVGIGTNSPIGLNPYSLAVYGPENVTGNISLTNNASGMSRIIFSDGSYLTSANSIESEDSYGPVGTVQLAGAGNSFTGNSTNFFWNTSTNRLGLGTATPGSLLDVQGSANVLGNLSVGATTVANVIISNTSVTAITYQIGAASTGILISLNVTSSGTSPFTIDTFSNTNIRTAHYVVQVTDTTDNWYQSAQIMLVQDGINVYKTEYNEIYSNGSIGNFDATITTGTLSLIFTPNNDINFTVKAIRTAISV
jgi:hypothetical protein